VVELSGKIDGVSGSCPALTFSLKGYAVRMTAATTLSKGPCKDLKNGREVKLTGEVEGPNRLLATRIEIGK
jgi:hypothetical protein